MFDDIYDNGERILGKIIDVKEHICRYAEDIADVKEIIEELEDYDEDTIVVVNYNHPMGCYMLESYWKNSDKIDNL